MSKLIRKTELTKERILELMTNVKDKIAKLPGAVMGGTLECDGAHGLCPLKHHFGEGTYAREIFMPKGVLLVSKIHKEKNPYFILKGDVSVMNEKGEVSRLTAPHSGMTTPGTQRILFMHEDTVWVTCHSNPDNKQDLKAIEDRLIAKNHKELEATNVALDKS